MYTHSFRHTQYSLLMYPSLSFVPRHVHTELTVFVCVLWKMVMRLFHNFLTSIFFFSLRLLPLLPYQHLNNCEFGNLGNGSTALLALTLKVLDLR